ncbi:hypothetical protein BHE74_00056715 [Ensete ventricosum]|nr:hypothetical protein BHE74_00056715 [Ensete ventricosum]
MPLYDCLLLVKPHVRKEALMDLVARVGMQAYQRNGVITDVKSFGTVQLGYGIKKTDGRHFQVSFWRTVAPLPLIRIRSFWDTLCIRTYVMLLVVFDKMSTHFLLLDTSHIPQK